LLCQLNFTYKLPVSGCHNIIWSDNPTPRLFADDNYNVLTVTYTDGMICPLGAETITGTTPICVGSSETWTSTTTGGAWTSGTPAVATVDASTGLVTGVSAGTSLITYTVTVGSCTNIATQLVTVIGPVAQTITGTTPLCIGSSATWTSTTTGGTWTSSVPSVATIDASTGLLTGLSVGTSVITYSVTVGGCVSTATKTVTISTSVPQTITGTTPLCIGATATWASTTSGGTWNSSNPGIASINSSTGLITGVAAGTAQITYSVTVGGCLGTGTQTVTITAPVAQTITGTTPICVGSSETWTSTTTGGTWTSSVPSVATIDASTGVVAGVSAGTSVISYSVTVGGCVNTATKVVTIAGPVAQTITGTTPLCVGSSATWMSTTTGGTWTSSVPSVATIDASTGLVTGITVGTSVITYSVTVGGCVSTATKTVTISTSIPQTITGTTPLCIGATATWTSTTSGGTWTSSNPGIATINSSTGLITGVAAGTSQITYSVTVGGCLGTGTKIVTVTAPVAQIITGTTPLCVGSSATWTSTTSGGTWSSLLPGVATVGSTSGVVTAISAGTSLITYSVTVGGCVNTASQFVTIGAPVAQTITGTTPLCIGAAELWTSTSAGGTWTSATTSVATVNSSTGMVTGVAAGTSLITYSVTLGGCVNVATQIATVTAPVAQTITGSTPLCVGSSELWTSTTSGGTWSSSIPIVATVVPSTGLVTGVTVGSSLISYTVTVGGCVNTATKIITTLPGTPQNISGTTPICVGSTVTWTSATSGGTWISADPGVATIGSSSGLINGISGGTSIITYSVTVGGCLNIETRNLTVTEPVAQIISGTTPLCLGTQETWTTTSPGGIWTSSVPGVATVNASGLVTTVSAGTSVITYTVTIGGCINTGTKLVTVTNPTPQTITGITPLCVGSSATWTSTTPGGTWISSVPGVATVGSANGVVTALTAGTSLITYSITDGGCTNTATKTVTVQGATPQTITGTTPLCVGTSATWTSTTSGGTWASSATAVATVDVSTGVVTGITAGTSEITYAVAVGGCVNIASKTVTIEAPVVQTINGTAALCVGSTANWSATSPGGTWSSADPGVATVGSSSGVVTAVGGGTSVITYTVTVGACVSTATRTVTITAPVAQTITGTTPLCVGSTATWTSTTTGGTWTSSATSIATVDAVSGLVTAVSGGTTVITYTVTVGSCVNTATKTVTVSAPVAQTITGTNTICIGSSVTWASTSAGGTWTSANPAVASVNDVTGVVTGVSAGTSVITYTVTIGACVNTATQLITVNPDNTVALTGGGTQTVCVNNPIITTTYATTGATGATIAGLPSGVTGNWAQNVVTISGTPTVTGVFNYTVTLTGGCGIVTITGTITVDLCSVMQIDSIFAHTVTLCLGDSAHLNILVSGGTPPYTYTWSGAGLSNETISNPSALPELGVNIYNVTVTDGTTTLDTSISIYVGEIPSVSLNYSCSDHTAIAQPTGMTSYEFMLNGLLVQDGSSNTYNSYAITNNDTISVFVTNSYGCTGTAMLVVNCMIEVEFPSAFTPDGDGINDKFPTDDFPITDYELTIFDRWGLQLYSGSSSGWDGRYNGTLLPPATYYYRVIITKQDGTETEKIGSITLVKN